jgi:hypothetical protein
VLRIRTPASLRYLLACVGYERNRVDSFSMKWFSSQTNINDASTHLLANSTFLSLFLTPSSTLQQNRTFQSVRYFPLAPTWLFAWLILSLDHGATFPRFPRLVHDLTGPTLIPWIWTSDDSTWPWRWLLITAEQNQFSDLTEFPCQSTPRTKAHDFFLGKSPLNLTKHYRKSR